MMVSAGIDWLSPCMSGMRSANARYPGDVRINAGMATRISTSTRRNQPVGRRSLALLTTLGVLARRRWPFRLRGQSIRSTSLSLPFDQPQARRSRHDRPVPADRLRAEKRVGVDELVVRDDL